jgi:hypothetical protein
MISLFFIQIFFSFNVLIINFLRVLSNNFAIDDENYRLVELNFFAFLEMP